MSPISAGLTTDLVTPADVDTKDDDDVDDDDDEDDDDDDVSEFIDEPCIELLALTTPPAATIVVAR